MPELNYTANPEQDAGGHRGEFKVVPPGWVRVVITASEIKTTAAGDGKMLKFTYEVQGAEGTIIDRLNIVNPSETAQKIGRGALAKIALAIGHKGNLTRTEVLHGRPFDVKVSVEDFISNTTGKMLQSNKCTNYRPVQASAPRLESKSPVGW